MVEISVGQTFFVCGTKFIEHFESISVATIPFIVNNKNLIDDLKKFFCETQQQHNFHYLNLKRKPLDSHVSSVSLYVVRWNLLIWITKNIHHLQVWNIWFKCMHINCNLQTIRFLSFMASIFFKLTMLSQ